MYRTVVRGYYYYSPKNDWRLRDKTKQNDDVVNATEFAVTHFTTHNLNVSLRHFQNMGNTFDMPLNVNSLHTLLGWATHIAAGTGYFWLSTTTIGPKIKAIFTTGRRQFTYFVRDFTGESIAFQSQTT